jgi:hypothetical protein
LKDLHIKEGNVLGMWREPSLTTGALPNFRNNHDLRHGFANTALENGQEK